MKAEKLIGIFFVGLALVGAAYEQGKIDEQNRLKEQKLQKKNKKNKK